VTGVGSGATTTAAGSKLSEQQLLDNIIGILIAGHDTTASTLGIVLFHLHTHPQARRSLHAGCCRSQACRVG
jgi:cytochrome P450